MSVGVLSLQGSFNEHLAALKRIGVKGMEIRKPEQLEHVAALIIPGGESTTMAKLAEYHNLFPALRDFVKSGKPVWGTCAGLIFLANNAAGESAYTLCCSDLDVCNKIDLSGKKSGGQELVGGLDCTVHRNFFGSQLQSFETDLFVPELAAKEGGPANFRGVFIRAPAILQAGPDVEILAEYSVPNNKSSMNSMTSAASEEEKTGSEEKVIVAVKQQNLLGTAFHPELTADTRWHSFFLKMAYDSGQQSLDCISVAKEDILGRQVPRSRDLPIFQ